MSLVSTAVANTTAAAVALPDIGADFGAPPTDLGAVVFAYVAAFALATAWYGGLGRRFGPARMLTFGAAVLAAGSLAAALAPSLPALIAARAVQGLGGGAIPTLAFTLLANRFSGTDRARAIGIHLAGVGAGQALGPLLGGVLVDALSWRLAVGLGALAVPGTLVIATAARGEQGQRYRLDLLGGALIGIDIVAAIWLLNRLPVLGWRSPVALVAAVFVAAIAITLGHTMRRRDTFLPQRILTAPGLARIVLLGALGTNVFLGLLTALPLALTLRENAGVALGLTLAPMASAIALTAPCNARVTVRIGRGRTTALALTLLGAGALTLGVAFTQPLPVVAASLLPLGIGYGLLNAPLAAQVSDLVAPHERPLALGLYNLGFFFGGAVGGAVSSALVQTTSSGFPRAAWLVAIPALAAAALLTGRRA